MVVAMLIASIGVLVDQPILIVGAMVVGPEFGPLVALCVGIVARRPRQTVDALGGAATIVTSTSDSDRRAVRSRPRRDDHG
jgi:hypothetical protein